MHRTVNLYRADERHKAPSGSPMETAADSDAGKFGAGIALHCQRLSLIHPTLKNGADGF